MNASFISYAAKAIAALITPWVLFVLAWIATNLNVDVPVEPGAVETLMVSLVTGIVVYLQRNAPRTT